MLCLAKSRQANGLISKIDQVKNRVVDKNLYKMDRQVFRNIGGMRTNELNNTFKRQAFKNIK